VSRQQIRETAVADEGNYTVLLPPTRRRTLIASAFTGGGRHPVAMVIFLLFFFFLPPSITRSPAQIYGIELRASGQLMGSSAAFALAGVLFCACWFRGHRRALFLRPKIMMMVDSDEQISHEQY
jgi:hypothetical protein